MLRWGSFVLWVETFLRTGKGQGSCTVEQTTSWECLSPLSYPEALTGGGGIRGTWGRSRNHKAGLSFFFSHLHPCHCQSALSSAPAGGLRGSGSSWGLPGGQVKSRLPVLRVWLLHVKFSPGPAAAPCQASSGATP